ncbi:hypothetical protein Tco_0493150 [Tanacetum coccineum]
MLTLMILMTIKCLILPIQDDIASAERLSIPDHLDHICEEVSYLHSRLGNMESSIVQTVSDEIKSSLPAMITDALKEHLPGILLATLKDCLPLIVNESLQTHNPVDVKDLLESAIIIDETAKGEKNQKDTNATLGEHAHKESTPQVSETKVNEESAMVLYNPEKDLVDLTTTEQDSKDDDDLDKLPLSKIFKIMHLIPSKPQPSVKQFSDQLFGITSSKFLPTPPREPTPPKDKSKGKCIATEEPPKDIMPFIEEGGSVPKIPNLKSFILSEGTLSQEKFMAQLKEIKRLADLKEQEKKSGEELKKLLNPATFKAQALKWEEHEEKKAKMLKEFNKCISERTSPLPITKISYVVNSSKTATMRITRDKDPLNLKVYPDSRLRMLGFSEWLEVHALASKKSGKSYDVLLQSLTAKLQWVLNQAKRLGLPPPPKLATFGLTTEEKKRKRTEFIKEMFVTEEVRVNRINRNLIPPPRVVPIEGLVIKEPESRIFYMNRNTDVVFQRESKFHLAPTVELIRIQNQIKVNSEIASEMYRTMNYVIEARDDCIEAMKTVQENLDNLG